MTLARVALVVNRATAGCWAAIVVVVEKPVHVHGQGAGGLVERVPAVAILRGRFLLFRLVVGLFLLVVLEILVLVEFVVVFVLVEFVVLVVVLG